MNDFFYYFTEPTKSGKMLFEEQKHWSTKNRLARWVNNQHSSEIKAASERLKKARGQKQKASDETAWRNITEACDYITHITPQTFRKYVREGRIPKGRKRRGYHEPLWSKEEIEGFKEWYLSHRRKV